MVVGNTRQSEIRDIANDYKICYVHSLLNHHLAHKKIRSPRFKISRNEVVLNTFTINGGTKSVMEPLVE